MSNRRKLHTTHHTFEHELYNLYIDGIPSTHQFYFTRPHIVMNMEEVEPSDKFPFITYMYILKYISGRGGQTTPSLATFTD